MAYSLNTKAKREAARNANFAWLVNNGYTRETFKDLEIFTRFTGKYFELKIFSGTGAHAVVNELFRTEADRTKKIEDQKDWSIRKETYKAERKEKMKLSKAEAEKKAKAGETVEADTRKSTALLKKMIKEKHGLIVSVRSEYYSGGCSLNISYEGGCSENELKYIKSALQYGRFDSMQDLAYSVDVSGLVVDGFKLAEFKHVFIDRTISENLLLQLCIAAANMYGIKAPETFKDTYESSSELMNRFNCWTIANVVHRGGIDKANFCTQDTENIKILSCEHSETEVNLIVYTYEYNGKTYRTDEKPTSQAASKKESSTESKPAPVETEQGAVQLVDYSEKSFAVIGETKPIKDKLKELGGVFNFRLSCGAGWIFSKTKLQAVQAYLESLQPSIQTETQAQTEAAELESLPAQLPALEYSAPKNEDLDEVFESMRNAMLY